MKRIKDVLRNFITYRMIHIFLIIISITLIILELLLLPWDQIRNAFSELSLSNSVTVLSVLCVIMSIITSIATAVSSIKTKKELKLESEKLDTTLSYIRMINELENRNKDQELLLKKLIEKEYITRKEYANLQSFHSLTNSDINIDEIYLNTLNSKLELDETKQAIERISNISLKKSS